LTNGVDDGLAIGNGIGRGLFAQDMATAFQRGNRLGGMEINRRGDDDKVNRRIEKVIIVGVEALVGQIKVCPHLAQRILVKVTKGRNFDLGMVGEAADEAAAAPQADKTRA
jgi:hypothetical protein